MAELLGIVIKLSTGAVVDVSMERIRLHPEGIYTPRSLTGDEMAEAKELRLEYWPQS